MRIDFRSGHKTNRPIDSAAAAKLRFAGFEPSEIQALQRIAAKDQAAINRRSHFANKYSPFATTEGFWGKAREHLPEELGVVIAVVGTVAAIASGQLYWAPISWAAGGALGYAGHDERKQEEKKPYKGEPLPKNYKVYGNRIVEGGEK